MAHPSNVAERIRTSRERLGLTQAALGARLGVTRSQVTLWETGGRNPSPTSLKQIAAALAISVEWLATGKGASKSAPGGSLQGVDEQLLELVVEAVQAAFKRRKLDSNSKRFAHTVAAVYAAGVILWAASQNRDTNQFHERLVDMADLAIGA